MTLSLEADRARDAVRRTESAFTMRKKQYKRAWKALQRGDSTLMDAYRAEVERKRERSARAPKQAYRRRQMRTLLDHEPIGVAMRAEWEAAKGYAAKIRAAEAPECGATTMRNGYRVACIRAGPHETHAGLGGVVW